MSSRVATFRIVNNGRRAEGIRDVRNAVAWVDPGRSRDVDLTDDLAKRARRIRALDVVEIGEKVAASDTASDDAIREITREASAAAINAAIAGSDAALERRQADADREAFVYGLGEGAGREGADSTPPGGLTEAEADIWLQGYAKGESERGPAPDTTAQELGANTAPPSHTATNGETDFEAMTDDTLREVIEKMTGEAPHHRTGRAKLIERAKAAVEAAGTPPQAEPDEAV
jgi:hypothetical protein